MTSRECRSAEEGFTLIEVLIAMLILAVGLLGLEALGIGAARSVTLAKKQSEYAMVASHYLERSLDSLRWNPGTVPNAAWQNVPAAGDAVQRTVASDQGLHTVTITVVPAANSALRPSSFTLTSSIYVP